MVKASHGIYQSLSWQQKHIVVVALSYDDVHSLAPGIGLGCRGGERRGRVTPWREGEMAVRGSGLNDVALRGSSSKRPWRGEIVATKP